MAMRCDGVCVALTGSGEVEGLVLVLKLRD